MKSMFAIASLIFATILPVDDSWAEVYLRPFGMPTTIDFCLYTPTASALFTTASFSAGEVKIMKDEGNEANTTNLPVDEGNCYSILLTAAEMSAQRIMLQFIDTPTATWLDKTVIVETTGITSALGAMTGSGAVSVYNAAISGVVSNQTTTTIAIPKDFRGGNLWLNATYTSGAAATLDVTVQVSPDNSNWVDYAAFSQVGTASSQQRIPTWVPMFRFIRLKYTTTGTAPTYGSVIVELWGEPK